MCFETGFSQERTFFASDRNFFWVPLSYSGEFRTYAHFRKRDIIAGYLTDTYTGSRFSVGGIVRSESYIWHPDFLLLNLEAEYNPDFIKDRFIVIPDLYENRTLKRFSIKTTLFNNKVISVNTNADFSQTYSNRENLTNIRTDVKQVGSALSFLNSKLPVNLSFNKTKWKQEETETDRVSNMDRLNFTARTSKSFYSNDKHDLTYLHDNYSFDYVNLYQTNIISDIITLNDNFNFDADKKYNFRSRVSYQNQRGTFSFTKLQADENLILKLPENFTFYANYNYNKLDREFQNTVTNNIRTTLRHKLYLSLNTDIFYEYRKTTHNSYEESYNTLGGNLYYTKKIPFKGRLNLSYNYRRQNFNTQSEPVTVQVTNESHILADGEITLLERPFIQVSSIIVTDITGAIVYQPDLDYLIIEHDNYVEIRRFPGGLIPDNTEVFVDYLVNMPETYSFDLNYNKFSSSISFWKKYIEFYFNAAKQNYVNLVNVDLIVLNYFTQYKYGIRTDVKFAAAGVEFDKYNSSIVPYEMIRYYASAQKTFKGNLILSLNADFRDYYLTNDNVRHQYSNISAKTVYRIQDITRASLELGYRKQIGEGIDLDLLTARLEFTSQFNKLFATLGFEKYNRDFLGEINNYTGVYFRLIRKFRN